MNNFCQRVIERLETTRLATPLSVRGCTLEEVDSLEKFFGVQLPKTYKSFLTCIGKQSGKLFIGTNCFCDDLLGLRTAAESLLKENEESFILPEDSFVFSMHQGYEFMFFPTKSGEDPPIFQYVEGQGSPQIAWSCFTNFLWESIEQHAEQYAKIK